MSNKNWVPCSEGCPGWIVSRVDRDSTAFEHIERCDACNRFADDEHAQEFVAESQRGLLAACEAALPWLILLGDYIGNGYADRPNGRCEAVAKVREEIRRAKGEP